jgi:hypothetical protein
MLAPLLALLFLTGCGIGGATDDGPVPTETGTRTPLPATATAPATATPTRLPDRANCDEVRGTRYRSPAERFWYLVNCVVPRDAPPPSGAVDREPLASPATPTVANIPQGPAAVIAIGDSVMLAAEAQVLEALPGVDFRATLGLQASGAIDLVRQLRAVGRLGDSVVVHIGNNGTFTANQFDQMMALLVDVDSVVFLNVRVDRSWEAPNNAMLAQNVPRYANARLVDWHAASAGHANYFWNDGIHLRPEGAHIYAALIAGNL